MNIDQQLNKLYSALYFLNKRMHLFEKNTKTPSIPIDTTMNDIQRLSYYLTPKIINIILTEIGNNPTFNKWKLFFEKYSPNITFNDLQIIKSSLSINPKLYLNNEILNPPIEYIQFTPTEGSKNGNEIINKIYTLYEPRIYGKSLENIIEYIEDEDEDYKYEDDEDIDVDVDVDDVYEDKNNEYSEEYIESVLINEFGQDFFNEINLLTDKFNQPKITDIIIRKDINNIIFEFLKPNDRRKIFKIMNIL